MGGVRSSLALWWCAAVAAAATGDIVPYCDEALFLSETGAVARAPIPNLGYIHTLPWVLDSMTFTRGRFCLLPWTAGTGDNSRYTTRVPGHILGVSGWESINIDLPAPAHSLGFQFVEPQFDPHVNGPFVDSTFAVRLLFMGAPVGEYHFSPPNDTAAFSGVWSDSPFDRVEIEEIVGGLENEFWGQFYTGTIPLSRRPCFADCEPLPCANSLDIFDFLCFQNKYDAGDPYACDCDTSSGPGVCDIFDFLCFQNAYDAGCP